jgi:hypothetical protein
LSTFESQAVVRMEADADRDAALEVERLAFSGGRGGEPADDIVTAIRAIRGAGLLRARR